MYYFFKMKRVVEEKEQLEKLCQEPLLSRIKEEYHKKFGQPFVSINPVGGSGYHYDLLLDSKIRVEYKGSKSKIDITRPWANGVQFLNGSGKSFSIGHWYATAFYPHLSILKELHGLTQPLTAQPLLIR